MRLPNLVVNLVSLALTSQWLLSQLVTPSFLKHCLHLAGSPCSLSSLPPHWPLLSVVHGHVSRPPLTSKWWQAHAQSPDLFSSFLSLPPWPKSSGPSSGGRSLLPPWPSSLISTQQPETAFKNLNQQPCPPVNGCRKEEINTSPPRCWPSHAKLIAYLLYPSLAPHLCSIKETGIQTPIRWFLGHTSPPSSRSAGFVNKVATPCLKEKKNNTTT